VRDNIPDSTLEDISFQEDAATALEALDTDVNPQPDHLPFIATAGMDLLQTDHVT